MQNLSSWLQMDAVQEGKDWKSSKVAAFFSAELKSAQQIIWYMKLRC
jgi:hypothetical protein